MLHTSTPYIQTDVFLHMQAEPTAEELEILDILVKSVPARCRVTLKQMESTHWKQVCCILTARTAANLCNGGHILLRHSLHLVLCFFFAPPPPHPPPLWTIHEHQWHSPQKCILSRVQWCHQTADTSDDHDEAGNTVDGLDQGVHPQCAHSANFCMPATT